MQTRMFVFIGFHDKNSNASLNDLQENLNIITKPFLTFSRKKDLLFARFEEISSSVSLSKNKNELDDWIQLATDLELSIDLNELNRSKLDKRYELLKKSSPNLYSDIHFSLATAVFDEMTKFSSVTIYSFQ